MISNVEHILKELLQFLQDKLSNVNQSVYVFTL